MTWTYGGLTVAEMTVKVAPPTERRKRTIELTEIANKCLTLAEKLGVKESERCRFGALCSMLWES